MIAMLKKIITAYFLNHYSHQKIIQEMAGKLYDSIFHKLLALGDGVMVCPAHGPGSVCGSAISDREWTTIGIERMANPRLKVKGPNSFKN